MGNKISKKCNMANLSVTEARSYNMSQIRSKNTKPEVLVRKFLFKNGFRFRLHSKKLPGTPDIILPKYKTVIFVNGCFWHGHENCHYFKIPKTRTEWWTEKIRRNIEKDKLNFTFLTELGYKVIYIWECDLKKRNVFENLINEILSQKTSLILL